MFYELLWLLKDANSELQFRPCTLMTTIFSMHKMSKMENKVLLSSFKDLSKFLILIQNCNICIAELFGAEYDWFDGIGSYVLFLLLLFSLDFYT